ncbi:MAG: Gfo/Idh/MocA family oxidoreductase, partial [Solobacterium sp.]|nr:Gfo/Idh/MocA family oxidoreductase [Solobacterium sp.]
MKVGMIGSGMIANVFLNTFQDKGSIRVEAIWCLEKHIGQTRELADKFNVKTVDSDIDRFLSDDQFDTVYIAVINSLHYQFAKKSLLAGKNV